MGTIKLSASTFSAGYLFATGAMDFEGFVRTTSEIGYTGIELVSAQLVPGYPYPSDEWVEETRRIMKKYNMEMAAYGGYVDTVRYNGRDLTPEEILSISRNDLVLAYRLGAPILKTSAAIGVDTLKTLLPDCERWGIWIGLELHGPESLHSDLWQPYLKLFEEDKGKHFGIVPDACILQELPNEMFVRESLDAGVSRARYDEIEGAFRVGVSLADAKERLALTHLESEIAEKMYAGFGTNMVADMDLAYQYCRYTHGKYFYIDEQDSDRGIDFAKLVDTMKRHQYDGYISAEYEGYFHDSTEDTVKQLQRYYRLMKKLI